MYKKNRKLFPDELWLMCSVKLLMCSPKAMTAYFSSRQLQPYRLHTAEQRSVWYDEQWLRALITWVIANWLRAYLALMRYWAALIVSGVPVMVTFLSDDPSSTLAILIIAPDSCLLEPHRLYATYIYIPVTMTYGSNAESMLGQRRRRLTSIKPTLDLCVNVCWDTTIPLCAISKNNQAIILVQVTVYRRLRICRDGHLGQSEAYDIPLTCTSIRALSGILPCFNSTHQKKLQFFSVFLKLEGLNLGNS